MKRVFADSVYWVALASPQDQWHRRAVSASRGLGTAQIITTEEVFVVFLAHFSGYGRLAREGAILYFDTVINDPGVLVRPQSLSLESRPVTVIDLDRSGQLDIDPEDRNLVDELVRVRFDGHGAGRYGRGDQVTQLDRDSIDGNHFVSSGRMRTCPSSRFNRITPPPAASPPGPTQGRRHRERLRGCARILPHSAAGTRSSAHVRARRRMWL
jgi:hypothetical protein